MSIETVTQQKLLSEQFNSQLVTYEQPLNEHIRLYLRLEHLFTLLNNQLSSHGEQASRLALETLLRIVDLADRPDLKSKLLQTLRQQSNSLAQLESLENVDLDTKKLQKVLEHLDSLVSDLHHHGSAKLGDKLRHNPFLKSIRLHLNNPAGPCNFNIPAYALWLRQPESKRTTTLNTWAKEFESLANAVTTILNLTRSSSPPQRAVAENYFYQQPLDANIPCQLVRVTLPVSLNLYPEFSVGKHRLSLQFKYFSPDDQTSRPNQSIKQVPFDLSCCRV